MGLFKRKKTTSIAAHHEKMAYMKESLHQAKVQGKQRAITEAKKPKKSVGTFFGGMADSLDKSVGSSNKGMAGFDVGRKKKGKRNDLFDF